MAGASGSRAAAALPPPPIVTSEEVNILIYTYLVESGFSHAAFNLRSEARLEDVALFHKFNPHPGSEEFAAAAASHPHSAANPSAHSNSAPTNGGQASSSSSTSRPRKGKGKDLGELGTTIPPPGDGTATPGLPAEEEQKSPKLKRGLLIDVLVKGVMYKEVETHCKSDGSRVDCRQPFTLIRPHVCSAQSTPLPTLMLDDLPVEEEGVLPPARSSIFKAPKLRILPTDPGLQISRRSPGRNEQDTEVDDVDMDRGETRKAKDGRRRLDEGPIDAPSPGASSSTSRSAGKTSKNGRVRMADKTDDEGATAPKKQRRNGSEDMPAPEPPRKGKGKATPKTPLRELPDSEEEKPGRSRSRRNSNASSSVKASEKESSPPKIKNPLLPVNQEGGVVSWRWKGQSKQIVHVVWNPANLNHLASCSPDGTALVWDFEKEGEEGRDLVKLANVPTLCSHRSVEKAKSVIDIAYSPDGNILATACADGIARVFLEDGTIQNINTRHTGELFAVAFSETDGHLATAGADGTINVWVASAPSSLLKMTVTPHTQEIFYVDFLDGDVFASCSADHTVAVARVSSPQSYKLLKAHSDRVVMVKFAPKTEGSTKGRLLASASEDKSICIWDVDVILDDLENASKSQEPSYLARKIEGHESDVVLLQWHPEGAGKSGRRLLLSADRPDEEAKHAIKMTDVTTGDCLFTLKEHTDTINSIEFSPKGSIFASCSDDHLVLICESETGKIIKRFELDSGVNDLRFRKDGKQLALAMQDRTVRTVYVGDLIKE